MSFRFVLKKKFGIAIALFSMFFFCTVYFSHRYSLAVNSSVDTVAFQVEINEQLISMQEAVSSIAAELVQPDFNVWNKVDQLKESEYVFLFYKNNHLIGWNSHLVAIPENSFAVFDSTLVHLKNGWFITRHRDSLNYRVVALMPVKYDYPYQNDYIQNSFNSCFGINHKGLSINVDELSEGYRIVDLDKKFMFNLVHNSAVNQGLIWAKRSSCFLIFTIIALFYLITLVLRSIKGNRLKLLGLFLSGMALAGFYYLFFAADWYAVLAEFDLFSPAHFAYTKWLSSIGHFIVLSIFVVFISFVYYQYFTDPTANSDKGKSWPFFVGFALVLGYFYLLNSLFVIVIKHSANIDLFANIIEFDMITLGKVFVVFFLYLSFLLLLEKLIKRFAHLTKLHRTWGWILAIVFVGWVANDLFKGQLHWSGFLFFVVITFYFIFHRHQRLPRYTYRDFLWIILLFDIYIVTQTFIYNIKKEQDSRQFLIERIADNFEGEQDPVAELFLKNIELGIANDANVKDMIANNDVDEEDIRQYYMSNYFQGYLSRYDLQVVTCWPKAELFVDGSTQVFDCYHYFDELVKQNGEAIAGSSHFYFMRKDNGHVNYFGMFEFFKNNAALETKLFLELASRPSFEGLGYPELLISKKEKNKIDLLNGYSYAKYVDGQLVKKGGDYLYKFQNSGFQSDSLYSKRFVDADEYSHLVYIPKKGVEVIMSFPSISASTVLIAFSVLYIIFFCLTFFVVFVIRFHHRRSFTTYSIQERIQIMMVVFMFFLLVVIGVSSVYYSIKQFKERNNDLISQRLKSIMLELDQKVGSEKRLDANMGEYLNLMLQNFSNVFYSDINLYNLDGNILATSRPELFQKGIMGNMMNPEAFRQLSIFGQREFLHDESIGSLKYISAYVPLVNADNQVLAYLNIPYFVGNNKLRAEISSMLVAIINAYFIIILITISIAVIASRQLTRPLFIIQQRLSSIKFGSKNEKISYSKKDEIGQLVIEYNRMVDELADSAVKLARSEREGAWREMAKQIAHEIKNPLTPMKLSVQYLQKAWDDKAVDFDVYINRVTKTLIDQINQLSVIATEFSHFAQMPVAKRESINIIEKLTNTVSMYEQSTDVEFEVINHATEKVYVLFDAEQILSVFNNLIKNAVQSIPSTRKGKIMISIEVDADRVVMAFADNGKGISDEIREKLFIPNFTTKSSGMGLGLSIVKNIIEGSNGQIWFSTKPDVGSVFYVSLPLSSDAVK